MPVLCKALATLINGLPSGYGGTPEPVPLHNVMSARISGVWRFPYAIPRTTAQLLESGWTILSLFAKVDEEPEFKVG